jgi:hypothetical protein
MPTSPRKPATRAIRKKPSSKNPTHVENGSKMRSGSPQGPVFAAADLERAREALIWTMNDYDMPKEVVEFKESKLAVLLRAREIPLALTRAIVDELVAEGVFDFVREFQRLTIFVPLNGSYQTDQSVPDRRLRTTPDRWCAYLNSRAEDAKSNTKAKKPKSGPKRPRDLEARDRWLYQQAVRRIPYKEIKAELQSLCVQKGWLRIASVQGIRQAAHRYAAAHKLQHPPSRKKL